MIAPCHFPFPIDLPHFDDTVCSCQVRWFRISAFGLADIFIPPAIARSELLN
jgi:hypothetical protein